MQQSTRELNTLFSATGTTVDDYADALGQDLVRAIRNGAATSEQLERALTAVGRQALGAEADLDRMRDTLRSLDSGNDIASIGQDLLAIERDASRAERSVDRLSDTLKDVGQSVGVAGAGIGAATFGLVEGFEEQNRAMARLKTNTSLAGQDYELMKEKVQELGAITGDTTKEVETLSNLQATGLNGDQMVSMVDNIAAAYIKYSDTLSTEGIADGFQETIALGEATGSFLELLEREGVNVDDFNARMAGAKTEAEKSTIAYNEFVNMGLKPTLDEYRKANPELDKHAQAQAEMKDALGELAIVLTPLVTKVVEFVTKIVEWANENKKLSVAFVAIATVVGTIIGVLSALAPIISVIVSSWGAIKVALLAAAGPIGIVIGVIGLLIAAGIALYKNWDTVVKYWKVAIAAIKTAIDIAFKAIQGIINGVINVIRGKINEFNQFRTTVQNAVNAIRNGVQSAFSGMVNSIGNAMNNARSRITGVWNGIMSFFRGINLSSIGSNMIRGLISGVTSMASNLANSVKNVVSGAINAAKNILKIKSPSRVFMEMGEFTNEGFIKGIESTSNMLANSVSDVYGSIAHNANRGLSNQKSNGQIRTNSVTKQTSIAQKQPAIIQLTLDNGRVLAETIVNDITALQNFKSARKAQF